MGSGVLGRKMVIPETMSEKEVMEVIHKVAWRESKTFLFGYFDRRDAYQQACLFCVDLLSKGTYDVKRPLANYLKVHVRRRLLNWQRDIYWRPDPPCKACHYGRFCAGDKPCVEYARWLGNNRQKASVLKPGALESAPAPSGRERETAEELSRNELSKLIDLHLPYKLRKVYLQMRDGVRVCGLDREEVLTFLRGLFHGEEGRKVIASGAGGDSEAI